MKNYIVLTLIILFFTGCASKNTKSQIKNEVNAAPVAKSNEEMLTLEDKMLTTNEGLTTEQKTNLKSLIIRMKNQNSAFDEEIMKTKVILFKTLIDNKYNKYKLGVLENQLIKLNRNKIRYSLSAYREARNISGKADVPLEKTLRMLDNRTIYDF